jgi:hypothetical protein
VKALFVILTFLLAIGCSKPEALSDMVRGTVVQKGSFAPIAFATVVLLKKEWVDGDIIYKPHSEIQTNESGDFSFSRSLGIAAVNAEQEGFHMDDSTIQPVGPYHPVTITLSSISWLKIQVLNIGENNASDHLFVYPHFLDHEALAIEFTGGEVNEFITGEVRANELWRVDWLLIEDNQEYLHHLETIAQPGDTSSVIIEY